MSLTSSSRGSFHQNRIFIILENRSPDVTFIGAVFNVIANGFEHARGGGDLPAIENLETNFDKRFLTFSLVRQKVSRLENPTRGSEAFSQIQSYREEQGKRHSSLLFFL